MICEKCNKNDAVTVIPFTKTNICETCKDTIIERVFEQVKTELIPQIRHQKNIYVKCGGAIGIIQKIPYLRDE